MLLQKKEKEERKYIKERMKKKKEFFRIRKSKKRKNGANARACVRIHRDGARNRFSDNRRRERPTDRKPLV